MEIEDLKSMAELARILPSTHRGKRVSPSTVYRWAMKGVRTRDGRLVKLEAVQVAGRLLSSIEALQAFSEQLNPPEDSRPLTLTEN